jgi:Zn-dependent protease with chaperone function
MPFLLLLVLTLVCLQNDDWPRPRFGLGIWESALLTWGGVALLYVASELLSRRLCSRLRARTDGRPGAFSNLSSVRRHFVYALLAFYALALYGFGWGWTVKQIGSPDRLMPGRELLVLAPIFAALFLSWSRFYSVERTAHEVDASPDPFLNRWAYVALQARHNLLLVLPPLFLLLVQESILGLFPEFQDNAFFASTIAALLVGGIFIGIPWILRLILGLKPLPDGPIRQRLLDTSRRLRFRCNDILVWNTRDTVANAMVTGPLPFLRYVVVTDRLLSALEPDEVEAVFGHEVGHVKHHHMAFYLGFVLASLAVLVAIREVLEKLLAPVSEQLHSGLMEWLRDLEFLAPLAILGVLAGYIFVVFGYLSRRCERQADIFGCRTVSCQAFINALEKVALLNGMDRERPGWLSSWQHSTIARRVDFLERMSADPSLERRFQRRVGILKWGVALILATMLSTTLLFIKPEQVWAILQ